jgi:serine protease inhibitor
MLRDMEFDDALRADFGQMTVGLPPEPIYEVNEEGTQAAAATTVAVSFGCAAVAPPTTRSCS